MNSNIVQTNRGDGTAAVLLLIMMPLNDAPFEALGLDNLLSSAQMEQGKPLLQ